MHAASVTASMKGESRPGCNDKTEPHIVYKWALRTYIDDTPLGVSDVDAIPMKFTSRIRKKRHTTSKSGLSSMTSNSLAFGIQLSAACHPIQYPTPALHHARHQVNDNAAK